MSMETPVMDDLERDDDVEATPATDSPVRSQLAELRAEYQELASDTSTTIPIGLYGGKVAVKYRYVPIEEIDAHLGQKLRRFKGSDTMRGMFAAMDTLIHACESVVLMVGDEEVALDPDDPDTPVNFGDPRLAEAMGFEPQNTARAQLKMLFANRDHALVAHAEKYMTWVRDGSAETGEAFLGE